MRARDAFAGSLLSRSFLASMAAENGDTGFRAEQAREFAALWRHARTLGRGAAPRARADVFAGPAARLLGFDLAGFHPSADGFVTAVLGSGGRAAALLCVTAAQMERARSAIVQATVAAGLRWALAFDGEALSLIDCARPHARRWIAADVGRCAADPAALKTLLAVMGAQAFRRDASSRPAIEMMIAGSEAALREVRATLQNGVERAALTLTDALARQAHGEFPVDRLFEQALTVVYRVLFLQFAEARGLVPVWHPTYRRAYTVAALREQIERGGSPRGVWESLQAMARLAHRGARAGELVVVPFNGRLFSPAHAPAVARRHVPDQDAAAAIAALTLLPDPPARRRIPFVDLGVEQLGSIYERVLDFTPEYDAAARRTRLRPGAARKNSGSFYTPRSLTELLVRRTLAPLVDNRAPEEILRLRVLDPAMGSGAFLVAACRFLARGYESALLRAGVPGAEDFSAGDRAAFRRLVAQHCLFGVDVNPMAVQLGRLSVWLCSLAADKPLTFLDHRLRVGNSLVGTTLADVGLRAPGGKAQRGAPTLFGHDALEAVGRAAEMRRMLDVIPDDTIEEVRRKEDLLSALDSAAGPLGPWRAICDSWCAAWFWRDGAAPGPREFGAMCEAARAESSSVHPAIARLLRDARAIARTHGFFHWPLEFSEVLAPPASGFDAVIGNPPWEMLRGHPGTQDLLRFTRDSGVFRLQSRGHSNAYQLFVERAMQLARPGGRLGLVLPWGIAADEGSAALREKLLRGCEVDELVVLDNRDGIFPIHRALKFVVLTATNAGSTEVLRMRPAVREAADLDRPQTSDPAARPGVAFATRFLERLSGPGLAVPRVSTADDLRLLEFLTDAAPAASSPDGWGLRFGRELNATDDRELMSSGGDGFPVIAGRHVRPFHVEIDEAPMRIGAVDARRRLGDAVLRHRVAYRDVSGADNRTTLIAAIVPPRVVTTHTLFCLKTRLTMDEQFCVCALLNSFIANYVARTRVNTHVTTAIVHALPLPRPPATGVAFQRIAGAARALSQKPEDWRVGARLQAAVAALYRLDELMLARILATFPLVPAREREEVMAAWRPDAAI